MPRRVSAIRNEYIREVVLTLLADKRLRRFEPYVYHVSRWDSVYIKFLDDRVGSIRIGDHEGREKYQYRWNLLPELTGEKVRVCKDLTRSFYSFKDVHGLILDICRRWPIALTPIDADLFFDRLDNIRIETATPGAI